MDLCEEGAYPDADEDDIASQSVEDIALTVDLARVDLVEQSHHHECVEDDGEVLVGCGTQRLTTAVHVEQPLT